MISFLLNKLKLLGVFNQNSKVEEKEKLTELNLSFNLENNLKTLKEIIGESDDIIIRRFNISDDNNTKAAIIYIDGLANINLISNSLLQPLIQNRNGINYTIKNLDLIEEKILLSSDICKHNTFNTTIEVCLSGNTVLLIDGFNQSLSISSQSWENRGVQEPKTEVVVRGPREGFTETIRSNTSLLRRKIQSPELTFDTLKIGERTKTTVSITYMKDIVNPLLVKEVKRRLKRIKTDSILESGYIEQFIEDNPFSPFPTIGNTEKPDNLAAKLLEGKIGILVDGTPFVLTVPQLFTENFQNAEDYYSRPFLSNFIRILRYLSFAISLLAPAIYVALTSFHQEIIPTPLLFTMAASKEGVPFPSIVEALIMTIAFEILREAGVRLPIPVGQAVSIVGALVIGDAAVSAGLISAPMVIVIAFTAIASFVVSSLYDVISILRIFFILLAGIMGGVGISIGSIIVLIHLASIRSFGVPYLMPLAPLTLSDLKDIFIRPPIWAMSNRPKFADKDDPQRQAFRLKPTPPDEDS